MLSRDLWRDQKPPEHSFCPFVVRSTTTVVRSTIYNSSQPGCCNINLEYYCEALRPELVVGLTDVNVSLCNDHRHHPVQQVPSLFYIFFYNLRLFFMLSFIVLICFYNLGLDQAINSSGLCALMNMSNGEPINYTMTLPRLHHG